LARAYEAAKRRDPDALLAFLRRRFLATSPPSWQRRLAEIVWRSIWTLNIDDTIERTYSNVPRRPQQAVTVDWTESYRPTRANELIVVHLHGRVTPPSDPNPALVFDIVEYLEAANRPHSWHHIFSDEFQAQPFIVVGARLSDEYDLAEILRRTNSSRATSGRPSFIVLRSIPPLDREDYVQWGLVPVEAAADIFFDQLTRDVRPAQRRVAAANSVPNGSAGLPLPAVRFLQQFRRLDPKEFGSITSHHDLYVGHDPEWTDIIRERDAVFEATTKAHGNVVDALSQNHPIVCCLSGPEFSGKSTALLRLARLLISSGEEVFLFRGEQALDVDAIVWWLERSPHTVLAFDGIADFILSISRLIDDTHDRNIRLRAIAAENSRRMKEVYSKIEPDVLQAGNGLDLTLMTDTDISALIGKLRSAGRLGRITNYSPAQQQRYFRSEHGRQLASAMAQLEGGRGFRDRLTMEYRGIEDTIDRDIYVASCITYAYGQAAPIPIVAGAAGVRSSEVIRRCSIDPLVNVVGIAGAKVKPRHRLLAQILVRDVFERDVMFQGSLALARQLAPYLSPASIRQRTVYHLIARQLMDHESLTGSIGQGMLRTWYSELEDMYDWNARFWEQRALAETLGRQFDRAESYAAKSVSLHRDPFTLNTLGTVLMRKAVRWFDPDSDAARDAFWRGVASLEESREVALRMGTEFEHPYFTFFAYALEFAFNGPTVRASNFSERLKREWRRWSEWASSATPFRAPDLYVQLSHWRREWLKKASVA
jgi:hypothetical protein